MNDELVSIITPAYRAASYVSATIESVLAQSYPHWEMLIADDCSPDDTRAVIADWARRDPRIRLIALPVNSGPAGARNAALSEARGRWIAFLDSDDLWLPDKLERSIAFAERHGAALTYTGYRRINVDGARTGHFIQVPPRLTYRRLLGNTAIATSTVLIDRRQTGEIRMATHVYYDDFVCWLGILKRGLTARGLNEDLMRYRVLPRSVSRNKLRSASKVWKIYRATERLGRLAASWHFLNYAGRAMLKYRKF
ncbi:glycosyltransferase family 2 protein [Ramlibacter sp. 2FC]|uniref:glycosyltransferase family 2 protein n=1 Tax=Ramlibacter sp. 2FC TaxID=2502188 RepID=UPI0010F8BEE5|nr:glycosyltransferase family 2 protein [Ramlibacter sp. 2FC]